MRRTNPWPAFADLFAALLVASFAGFIMLTGAYKQELNRYKTAEKETTRIRAEADLIIQQIRGSLDKSSSLRGVIRKCGDDTCIDLNIHFEKNYSTLANSAEKQDLGRACEIIKNALDALPPQQKKDIELIIEGHTDSQQALSVTDPRERYLYNWNLSSQRATSVAYEFQLCDLKPPVHQVVAIGYADSMPICQQATQDCYSQNRRTTLRLRADTRNIERRLQAGAQ